ncbi:MAG: PGPGW domain-containing protein [Bacteroidota bacterium]|nr:PGPGW domain-containing protein [Bacteroidota bacterium]MDP4190075.1 PGPGW domain-containing protein [Bacteroidota bacterium]MDP4193690.1 PGPGW domain-containing protein [Bacteroidota bacterium]
MKRTLKQVKRLIVGVVGFTVTLIGVAMIVLPGPAFIVIPAGLAILATEFLWARKLLDSVKEKFRNQIDKAKGKNGLFGRFMNIVHNIFGKADKKQH